MWTKGFHTLTPEGLQAPEEGHPRYAFADGMNTIGKLLAEGLHVQRSATVTELSRAASGWQVGLDDGTTYTAERVLVNVPAPQALALARDVGEQTRQSLSRVEFAPCLAVMAEYTGAVPEWSGIVVKDDANPLSWLANDADKRAHEEPTVLVLHANPTFSTKYLETPEAAVPEMLEVAASFGFADPRWTQLQRWRYAKATSPYDGRYLKEDDSLFFLWRLVRRGKGRRRLLVGVGGRPRYVGRNSLERGEGITLSRIATREATRKPVDPLLG